MKNLIFSLVFLLVSNFGFASNEVVNNHINFKSNIHHLGSSYNNAVGDRSESVLLTFTVNNVITNYKFESLASFNGNSNKTIEAFAEKLNLLNDEEKCEVTITITVTVTVNAGIGVIGGTVSTSVSGSVTTSCKDAKAAGVALKNSLVAIAQG